MLDKPNTKYKYKFVKKLVKTSLKIFKHYKLKPSFSIIKDEKAKDKVGAHCTEIDFALSFGAVIVKMIDLSKTESRDFFGIILDQKKSQELHLLPKSC